MTRFIWIQKLHSTRISDRMYVSVENNCIDLLTLSLLLQQCVKSHVDYK